MSIRRSVPIFLLIISVLFTTSLTGKAHSQTCTDADGDGWGVNGDASCPGTGEDCDDTDPTVHPGAQKICDGKDNNCDGKKDFTTDEDKDLDGVPWCAQDCDDNNPNRAPNILEAPMGSPVCLDGIDNDCDNRVDSADQGCQFSCFDSDGDGYGINGDASCDFPGEIDCNDNDDTINPGVVDDSCNGIDNNCSTVIDDEYVIDTLCGVGECLTSNTPSSCVDGVETLCIPGSPSPEGVVGSPSCTDGVDNDCDGLSDTDPACQVSCQDFDEDGYGTTVDVSCQFAGIDCDDSNALINPGGDDANCNGIDEDCVGGPDSGYAADASCGTGLCNTTNTPGSCTGGVETACQPGAPVAEDTPGVGVCIDGVDNDCDGLTDSADSEGCSSLDVDDDGDGYTENQNDCNDGDPTMYPGAPKICDGKDNNCDGKKDFTTDEDKDLDGVPWCAQDCDDNNPDRAPNIFEGGFGSAVCTDGIDNDCDNRIDSADLPCQGDCIDTDGDGYGVNGDTSCDIPGEVDCDDTSAAVNPAGDDANCNGIDEDCVGGADSGYVSDTLCGTGECQANNTPSTCAGGVETACQPGAPVLEGPQGDPTCSGGLDEDCDDLIDGNDPGCNTLCIDQDGDGYGSNGHASCPNGPAVDCDDSNAAAYPGGDDANCNGIDEDCVGGADSGYVVDAGCGTGLCNTTNTPSSCTGGVETLCQEGTPGEENVTIAGTCTDGVDNDCDGDTDAVDSDCSTAEIDNDGDGYCRAAACTDGSSPNDCDDTDPNVYPGAAKICDGKDSNCDGKKDSPTDEDKDLDGVPWCAGDCDDNNPLAYPGNTEGPWPDPTCTDGIDNDCDGTTDCPPPTCDTKTSPRNGPHSETMMAPGPDGLPNTGDDITHPENNDLLCGKCHGVNLQDPVRSQCERCHTAGGASKAAYPDPWPFGFGSAPDVQMHSSTVLGTKYGAWDMDCMTCHNPHSQEQDGAYGTSYGKYIKEYICFDNPVTAINVEEIVKFTAPLGADSFADGPPYVNNICEMCHTQTAYHRRDGSTATHRDGEKCTDCHSHSEGFRPPGVQSHSTHVNGVKGPRLTCISGDLGCHGTFEPPLMADGNGLISTAVCDNCHSPGGAFDGVNDSVIGAKANWNNSIYDDRVIASGKELWCAGCHDDSPANSRMNGYGVSAANVIGDDTTFGFYITGHGQDMQIDCTTCHDVNSRHIDHESYHLLDVVEGEKIFNLTDYRFYQEKRIEVKHPTTVPDRFRLCFTCHDESWITDIVTPAPDLETNFRKDQYNLIYQGIFKNGNLHAYHTGITSCSSCHNVHGLTIDSTNNYVPTFTRMMREWAGSYVNLTYDVVLDKYVELTDSSKWNDPLYNHGGASTSPLFCGSCHGYTDLTNGVGPTEAYIGYGYGQPWYLRTYKPHTYPVVFDMDSDGLNDNLDNCPGTANIDQADGDIDYIGDLCDSCPNDPINDADIDGLCGDIDICPYDSLDDYDGDGICGDIDNCDAMANPLQSDIDEDGVGDVCDNCTNAPNPAQANLDGDMLGDVCDATCSSYIQLSMNLFTLPEFFSGTSAVIDSAGNTYITGYTEADLAGQVGLQDMVLIKYDGNGNTVWISQFGTTEWDFALKMVIDSNDNLFIIGRGGTSNYVVVKYDSSGNHEWMFQTPGFPRDIAVDNSGYVYPVSQYGVIKLDNDGIELWTAPQSGSFIQYPMSIDVDNAANVYVAGMNQVGFYDLLIKKFDTNGAHQWTTTFDPDDWTYIDGIAADDQGNTYVTGTARGNWANINYDYAQHYTFKLDAAGDLSWIRQVANSVMIGADKITIDNSGNIFVTNTGTDLISYDPDGNQRFVSHFEVPDHFTTFGLIYDSAGSAYLTGLRNTAVGAPQELFIMNVGGSCQ